MMKEYNASHVIDWSCMRCLLEERDKIVRVWHWIVICGSEEERLLKKKIKKDCGTKIGHDLNPFYLYGTESKTMQ